MYNDFQGKPSFYKYFSTPFGYNWVVNNFGNGIFLEFKNLFKNCEEIKSDVRYDTFSQFNKNFHNIVIHRDNINTDKFSTFLLPLIIYHFPQIEKVISIGFGDFEAPRLEEAQNQKLDNDYNHYKFSFNRMNFELKQILEELKIKIEFLNSNSYYNK